jgi:hypothetical protein
MKVRRRKETAMAGHILRAWVSLSLAGCWSRADQKPLEQVTIWVSCFDRYDDLKVDGQRVDTDIISGSVIAFVDRGHHVLTGRFEGKYREFPFETRGIWGHGETYMTLDDKPPPAHIR